MIEWEAAGTFGKKSLRWRGVDRVCLRDGRTYERQVYWDTRGLAESIAEAVAQSQNG
jgi:hypothetical protein